MTSPPQPPRIARLKDLGKESGILYLRVAEKRDLSTRDGKPYVHLVLADTTGSVVARVWVDHPCFQQARTLQQGDVVKVLGRRTQRRGEDGLDLERLRPAAHGDAEDWDPEIVFGPAWHEVRDLAADELVIDIETVPLTTDMRDLPQTLVQEVTRVAAEREWQVDKVLALNPLFSKVACIAVGDAAGEGGACLIAPEAQDLEALRREAPPWLLPMSEERMIGAFWTLAARARRIVTFNGRSFDLPFLRTRSAVLGQPVFVDLLSDPPWAEGVHLDLLRVLAPAGRPAAPANLDAVCHAFGIESPKGAMDGSMVGEAWGQRRYLEVARYNLADVEATRLLYRRLKATILDYLKR